MCTPAYRSSSERQCLRLVFILSACVRTHFPRRIGLGARRRRSHSFRALVPRCSRFRTGPRLHSGTLASESMSFPLSSLLSPLPSPPSAIAGLYYVDSINSLASAQVPRPPRQPLPSLCPVPVPVPAAQSQSRTRSRIEHLHDYCQLRPNPQMRMRQHFCTVYMFSWSPVTAALDTGSAASESNASR